MKKIFANQELSILKVEGDLHDRSLGSWAKAVADVKKNLHRQVILDFSSVSIMSPNAVKVLEKEIGNDMYVLNCPPLARNMMAAAGFKKNILD